MRRVIAIDRAFLRVAEVDGDRIGPAERERQVDDRGLAARDVDVLDVDRLPGERRRQRIAAGRLVIDLVGALAVARRGTPEALEGITDDQGRYRFDNVKPGTYVVSAYYSVSGRGQIEIRRSDIAVAGGEGVIVPIWIEVAKQ